MTTARVMVLLIFIGLGGSTLALSALMTLSFFEQAVTAMLCLLVVMKGAEMIEGGRNDRRRT